MSSLSLNDNLQRILSETERFDRPVSFQALSESEQSHLNRIVGYCFLSNGMPSAHFSKIVRGGRIQCREELGLVDSDCDEVKLGTANCVFLFAAPFRYPSSDFGLLFKPQLEINRSITGSATPFDSGGCVKGKYQREDMAEQPRDFFERHRLPIPQYRDLLREHLQLFDKPEHYFDGTGTPAPHPFGLSGYDPHHRIWTFELQINHSLSVRDPSILEAVFIDGRRTDESIDAFEDWCRQYRIPVRHFYPISDPLSFDSLQNACIDYYREKLIV